MSISELTNNSEYLDCLQKVSKLGKPGVGCYTLFPPGQSKLDKSILSQNNLQIVALVKILEKLNRINSKIEFLDSRIGELEKIVANTSKGKELSVYKPSSTKKKYLTWPVVEAPPEK